MPTISIRLANTDLEELNDRSRTLHLSRTEYIRQAVAAMNERVDQEQRRDRIFAASQRVRVESMRINAEFEAITDLPDV